MPMPLTLSYFPANVISYGTTTVLHSLWVSSDLGAFEKRKEVLQQRRRRRQRH